MPAEPSRWCTSTPTGSPGRVELDDLDLDTDLDAAAVVIEWGEGVAEQLSDDRLTVELVRLPDDTRTAELTPVGASWRARAAAVATIRSQRGKSLRFGVGRPRRLVQPCIPRPTVEGAAGNERASTMRERATRVTGQSRVLVVDDDDTVREVLRRYLTRDGHEVIEAADGITGLSLVRIAASRPAGARPDAARHGRPRGLPGDPPHLDHPGDHADRAGAGIRSGGRPGVRRRRLRRQTVQSARAGAAGGAGAGTQPGQPSRDRQAPRW